MRSANLALAQKRKQVSRNCPLAGMRSGLVDPFIERGRRASERFERHRAGNVSHARETFCPKQRKPPDSVHRLSAVEEREAFLGLNIGRLKAGLFERGCAGYSCAS